MQIPPSTKTALCQAKTWVIRGPAVTAFYLRLPSGPETLELDRWLRQQVPIAAAYFAARGGLVARQYRLPMSKYRRLWGMAERAGVVLADNASD